MGTTHLLSLRDFNFDLPTALIAQEPVRPRDHSRLLVMRRTTANNKKTADKNTNDTQNVEVQFEHRHFIDIVDYLEAGDVLVVNNSKVIRARLHGTKPTGGKIEVFLIQAVGKDINQATTWECMIRSKRLQPGTTLTFPDSFTAVIQEKMSDTTWQVEFNKPGITQIGEVPLPPYIAPPDTGSAAAKTISQDYQTVYAKTDGSVAAPTAGLHFTPELLATLEAKGVIVSYVTLHVGLGTFAPVKTENISEHVMHAEFGELPTETAAAIVHAKTTGHKVVAVGTTSARTLEAFADQLANIAITKKSGSTPRAKTITGWIDIFITPGYQFKVVDALITNFHLPKSTLLMLVSALAGKKNIDHAYQIAIEQKYRFYSFGDAMLILP